jgi:hypothetical protein
MAQLLGQLTKLALRKVWKHEASDFTPWLAREENIAVLGEALGMELEVENTEVAVGPYSADILARDTGDSAYVVIENQLGRTDHDHLGKAITYAAALNAKTIVWIASDFTDEHRRAIDWLNDNSSENVWFFGVQPELWQIDGSKPALRFNVLSRPPEDVRKAVLKKASGELTEVKQLQLEWWTAFRSALLESREVPAVQAARAQYWYNVAVGRTGMFLSNTANTWDNKIGVRLYLQGRHGGDIALAQLQEGKEDVERELGMELEWNPNPDNRDKIIAAYHDADLNNRGLWPEHCEWMVKTTVIFREVFGPRIRELDLRESAEDTGDQDEPES